MLLIDYSCPTLRMGELKPVNRALEQHGNLKMKNNDSILRMKREATNYARLIQQDFGKSIQRSEALEKVAYLNGFPNWDTAVALASESTPRTAEPLSHLLQYSQLQAFQAGLRGGGILASILEILARQSDPRLAKGWASVHKAIKRKAIVIESWPQFIVRQLRETNFFDDQVVLMMEMSAQFESDTERCLDRAVDYLKTLLEMPPIAHQVQGLAHISSGRLVVKGQNGDIFQ
jgi:hypothetical protein